MDKVMQIVLGARNRFCVLFDWLTPVCTGCKLKVYERVDGARCVAFGETGVYVVL